MPDLEKPDNQNNSAQSGSNQEQKVLEMPEHASQPESTPTPQQQTSEQNKETISYEKRLQKNESFRDPNVHEKNSLLDDLKNKLNNIDAIIKKANLDKAAATKENKQETSNTELNTPNAQEDTHSAPQQLLEQKHKDEAVSPENSKTAQNNQIPDGTKNTQAIPQQVPEEKLKDEPKQTENNKSVANSATLSKETEEKQNDQAEQTATPQVESKPEEIKQTHPQDTDQKPENIKSETQEMPQSASSAAPKDYSNITTFGEADEAIKAEPENYKRYVARAELYIKKQDYKNAETDYKKAQELTQSKDIANPYRSCKSL
ncbi:hypothetical protein [Candidatus Endomicrobiellum devescovinae]|jgi:hypothetical protein|uniref:hypothetical protein n=1 Tax=Candidatus Endomicrobiellum devescovinae TaxID=3242322 RepID=UPI00281F267D|nr:hypothetical protein [Endomicrobium sp.]